MTLSDLERLAREATPGPWKMVPSVVEEDDLAAVESERDGWVCEMFEPGPSKADAAFIAACDPDTVLALLRVVRAAAGLYARDAGGYVAVTPSTMAELNDALAALNLKDET